MTEQVSKFPPEYLEQYSGNRLLATSIAFLVIDTFFVALRFLAQHLRPIKYGLDDLFIALAWLFMVLECAINIGELETFKDGITLYSLRDLPNNSHEANLIVSKQSLFAMTP